MLDYRKGKVLVSDDQTTFEFTSGLSTFQIKKTQEGSLLFHTSSGVLSNPVEMTPQQMTILRGWLNSHEFP